MIIASVPCQILVSGHARGTTKWRDDSSRSAAIGSRRLPARQGPSRRPSPVARAHDMPRKWRTKGVRKRNGRLWLSLRVASSVTQEVFYEAAWPSHSLTGALPSSRQLEHSNDSAIRKVKWTSTCSWPSRFVDYDFLRAILGRRISRDVSDRANRDLMLEGSESDRRPIWLNCVFECHRRNVLCAVDHPFASTPCNIKELISLARCGVKLIKLGTEDRWQFAVPPTRFRQGEAYSWARNLPCRVERALDHMVRGNKSAVCFDKEAGPFNEYDLDLLFLGLAIKHGLAAHNRDYGVFDRLNRPDKRQRRRLGGWSVPRGASAGKKRCEAARNSSQSIKSIAWFSI
jgi:hypothetical protein